MATPPNAISLDTAPPLPPEVAQTQAPPTKGANLQSLMGQPGGGGVQHGAVIQSSMQIEQQLLELARMMPNFAPVSDQIIQLLRTGVQNSIQASRSQSTPGASPMGMAPAQIS